MTSTSARSRAFLPALALMFACRASPDGTYELQSVNGHSLPAGVEGGPGDTLWIFGASILFSKANSATRTEHLKGWRRVDTSLTSNWHYTMQRDSIMLVYDCSVNMICPGEEPGILRGDTLIVVSSRFANARLTYQRSPR